MLKSVGANLGLLGFTFLGIWVMLESFFYLAAPQIPVKEPLMYAPHPVLRYIPNPGVDKRYRTTEFDTRVAFDSEGFRKSDRPESSSGPVFRILCLGDSFTLGAEVAVDDSYPHV